MESLFVICDGKNGIKLTYAELYSGICEQWNYCLRRQKYSTSHTHGLDGTIAVEYRGERASWVHMNQTVGHNMKMSHSGDAFYFTQLQSWGSMIAVEGFRGVT